MQILAGEIVRSDITKNAMGGSELMAIRLQEKLPKELLKEFQIVVSRVRDELRDDLLRVLWNQDLADDPQSQHLANEGWKKWHKIVFVSYWQRQQFVDRFGIPLSRTAVLQNSIQPLMDDRPTFAADGTIRFIYHTTPHRGLELLVPVFEEICKHHDNVHLDVYSSFKIYGWGDRDKYYEQIFKRIEDHPKMTQHGSVPNDEIRKALLKADVYAYPCIWQETSCLSLIEALAAGCLCIHSDLGVLPETAHNWSQMYTYQEDPQKHAEVFFQSCMNLIDALNNPAFRPDLEVTTRSARQYMNAFYDFNLKADIWTHMLSGLLNEPRALESQDPGQYFVYKK